MNELKCVYDKSLMDKLEKRISTIYPKEALSIIDVRDDEDNDFVSFTVRYYSPDWLVCLGKEMQYVRTYFKIL